VPATGYGRYLGVGDSLVIEDLFGRPDAPSSIGPMVARDWLWGGAPPAPVVVPYSWLDQPLHFRPDAPVNYALVSRVNGNTARSVNKTSSDASTEYRASGVTLDCVTPADPPNLADHVTGNFASPRMRCPSLTFDLLIRTDPERQLLLGVAEGQPIVVSGTPASWPEGTASLVIEGVRHVIGIDQRTVIWNTSPVVGSTPGTAGPWFRLDASKLDTGSDKLPF
jgi:hypothetical protein